MYEWCECLVFNRIQLGRGVIEVDKLDALNTQHWNSLESETG